MGRVIAKLAREKGLTNDEQTRKSRLFSANDFGIYMTNQWAWLQAKGIASSLDEYQGSLVPIIDDALSQLDDHTK
jgi:hypothetical protein